MKGWRMNERKVVHGRDREVPGMSSIMFPVYMFSLTLLEMLLRERSELKEEIYIWHTWWDLAQAEVHHGTGETVWWEALKAITSFTGISARLCTSKKAVLETADKLLWKECLPPKDGLCLWRQKWVSSEPISGSGINEESNGRKSWIKQTLHGKSGW